jgi:hypothetical protein
MRKDVSVCVHICVCLYISVLMHSLVLVNFLEEISNKKAKTHRNPTGEALLGGLCLLWYLGQGFGAGVQLAPVDVELSPLVPEPPCVQQVAVVLNPALDPRVLDHVSRGAL